MILRSAAKKIVFFNHRDTKTQRFSFFNFVPLKGVLKRMPLCLCGAFIMSLATTLFLTSPSLAASVDNLHRQGAEAYGASNYELALDLFSQAVTKKPVDANSLYNQGTALFKLGRFSEAAQGFAASAEADKNKETRARAGYNQGRAHLAAAGESQDLAQKKELLLAGNQAFQQALRDDPHLKAARKGIVDFRREFAQINQQPPASQQQQGEQQNQSCQGQEDQQDLKDQLTEAGQQQQDMANQSKGAGSDSAQEGQLGEMEAQQQGVRQALEKIKEELNKDPDGQSDGGQGRKDLAKGLDKAISAQKNAEDALNQGDLSQAQEHQQNAADNLQEMAANLAADQQDKTEQSASAAVDTNNQAAATADQHQEGQEQGAAKSDSTVADILDGEKALHEMRRLRIRQQRPASGKDW